MLSNRDASPLPSPEEWRLRSHESWMQAEVGTEGSMLAEWRGTHSNGVVHLQSKDAQASIKLTMAGEVPQ
eukprot:11053281-Prorocentrum_lima.AAC.1